MKTSGPHSRSSDAARRFSLCETTAQLNVAVSEELLPYGVTAYAIGYVPQAGAADPDPFMLLNWPRAWLELYAREGFAQEDIVVAEASRVSEPFTWQEIRARYPNASARVFAAAKASFGWIDGFLVPLRSEREGRLAVASLALVREVGPEEERHLLRDVSTLAFRKALSLAKTVKSKTLTSREREVISLVAKGRSDRELAEELTFSLATARFHVEQAKRKLGAKTRSHAVALAIASGLIN